jgi:UDP-N-acetylmuramoyl-tripeptide--D-alanyl-D-alanine ligase
MKLSKDFLSTALHDATYIFDNKVVSMADNAVWLVLEKKGDVNVSIDSRTLQAGELFVPLKGPNFDGHNFIKNALENGACGALISQEYRDHVSALPKSLTTKKIFIVVPDTLKAFIDLAKGWRARLQCPLVGVTGSVGKTTTKEMLRTIVQASGLKSYASFKNYNNVFGVCYNILRIPESVDVAILEMGINECGEMKQLADIVRPTIGLITCVAHAHLEGLGNSLQGVAQEKRQLFAYFNPSDVGVVNGDQSLLGDMHYAHPIARFGIKTKNQVQARKIRVEYKEDGTFATHFMLKWYGDKAQIQLKGNHPGFVSNALAASAAAYFLKISFQSVIDGLQSYQGIESRFEIKKLKNNKGILLNDCYNANPESMKAALLALSQFKSNGPKIAVLGDMLELGQRERYWHRQVGRVISKSALNLQALILVGERARSIGKTAPLHLPLVFADDWQEAQKKLESQLIHPESVVLVKASHGIRLDNLVKGVTE